MTKTDPSLAPLSGRHFLLTEEAYHRTCRLLARTRITAAELIEAHKSLSTAQAIAEEPGESTVAILTIRGVITPFGSPLLQLLGLGDGGLTAFQARLARAVADDTVSAIVLNIDSPGGRIALVPETAAKIREAGEAKPVVAVANVMAASAAYWLASQASELVVTPSGEVGSIGVLLAHEDWSRFEERLGVKTTLISAGKYKTDGNPVEPLSESAEQHFQEGVNTYYDQFVAGVALGRDVKEQAVREGFGEGRMVLAEQAVEEGMADRVATLEEVISSRVGGGGASGGQAAAQAPSAEEPTPAPTVEEPAPAEGDSTEEDEPSAAEESPEEKPSLSAEDKRRIADVLLS